MARKLFTKELNGVTINIWDTLGTAKVEEDYTNAAHTVYEILAGGVAFVTFETTRTFEMNNPFIVRDGGSTINPDGPWMRALYFDVSANGILIMKIAGNDEYNGLLFADNENFMPACEGNWDQEFGSDKNCTFSTNLPIFETWQDADLYCSTADVNIRRAMIKDKAVNYVSDEYETNTEDYYIENYKGLADCVRNSATLATGGAYSYRSMRFQANAKPVLYFNADYSLTLMASGVVASASQAGPLSVIDMMPESAWTEKALAYTGLWYGNIITRMKATGETIPDGQYMYGFNLNTNVYIFENQAAAEQAIEDDDFSNAVNFAEVSTGGGYNPPEFGDDEQETEFGDGGVSAPMCGQYILSSNELMEIANNLFSNTTSVIDAVLDGLKMYGAQPIDVIASLFVYPFDVKTLVNSSTQTYIYFGSYQMTNLSVERIVNYKNAYLDAGTIFLASLQHSYRDFEPYTQLSVYLPYCGWHQIDIGKYIDKYVNIRYYVDLHTGSCIAVLIANGVMVDYFTGQIGAQLPVTANDLRSYSSAVINTILGGAGGIGNIAANAGSVAAAGGGAIAGAAGAAGIGGAMGAMAGPVGMAAGMAVGVGLTTASTLFQLEKMGLPKDHAITKGNFTGQLGMSMPQYVLFRYDIFDGVEPNGFNEMCGRPSNASGLVSSFSGYLSCRQVSLNTNGMLDAEIKEVYTLLKGGIYI